MTTTKHIHHDVIIEWAKGATIQYYSKDLCKWVDCHTNPGWYANYEYRVKTKKEKYRVALFKWNNGNVSAVSASTEEDAKEYEEYIHFVRWLTDWIEYEV